MLLAVFFVVTPSTAKHGIEPDSLVYLTAADNILSHGVMNHQPPFNFGDGPVPPGAAFVPGYPAMIAALAMADDSLRETVHCVAQRDPDCGTDGLRSVILAQKILWLAALVAIFITGRAVLAGEWAAVAVVGLVIVSGMPGDAARRIITETLCFTAFFGFLAALARSHTSGRAWSLGLAGLFLGLTILVRPGYQAIVLPCALMVFAYAFSAREGAARSGLAAGMFLLACVVVVAPWVARNAVQFGDAVVTAGYGSGILMERLAYNAMTWPEWCAAFVYWLPVVGDEMAAFLFGSDVIERLRFDAPTGFYIDKDLAFAGLPARPPDQALGDYLLTEGVFGNLGKHVAVTLPLMVRGSKVGWLLFPLAIACLWPAFRYGLMRGRLKPFLIVALPPIMMLAVHAAVSVNVPRYNLSLVLVYALIVAAALPWAAGPVLRRFR